MCGICGFNWKDEKTLSRMTRIMRHRGPDQSGFFSTKEASLGHQRLSIIDLNEEVVNHGLTRMDRFSFPMIDGEIYNFEELRRILEGKGPILRAMLIQS